MDRDLTQPVKCRSGHSACDHPISLDWEGKTLQITAVIKEWREPGNKHYLVETVNKSHFKLTFSEISSRWTVREVSIKYNKQG